ncbi:hypothetical protein IW261DRAFT_1496738 [Armillaria novae-zelandiae]|uniref:F-box domain-containing protein n=1 Tax=Armillaria novae-zelandiae TaxID=153914 RepID=A0AA39U6E0_9AGAR|nr:hypothetical protein IW261DRAFT_1496738 [Armillaria novae-zelandiae]
MASTACTMSSEELMDALMYRIQRSAGKWNTSKLDRMEKRLQTAVAVVRGARNFLQPINRIPPELLAAIFSITQHHLPGFLPLVGLQSPYAKAMDWLCVLRVCRHWRGIAATFHPLWATIDTERSPHTFLKRSADSLITVVAGFTKSYFDRQYLTAIIESLPRIRELHADFWDTGSLLGSSIFFTEAGAPNLVSLSLLMNKEPHFIGMQPTLHKLFNDEMPKLKHLCLGYFTSWPKGYFTNLTHLCLYDQEQSSRPSTSAFLDILETSPQLETLALVNAGPTRYIPDDLPLVPLDRLVSLRSLRELSMNCSHGIFAIPRLLSHLSLSKHANLFFWGSPLTNHEEELSSLFPSSISHLENLQNITEYRLVEYGSNRPANDTIVVVDGVLFIHGRISIPQLATIPLRFPLSRVKTLLFEASLSHTSNNSHDFQAETVRRMWRDTFDYLPSMEIFVIRSNNVEKTKRILEGLYPRGEGSLEIPCPHLKSLRLEKYTADTLSFLAFFIAVLAQERHIESVEIVSLEGRSIDARHDGWGTPGDVWPVIGSDLDSDTEERDAEGAEDEIDEEGSNLRSDGIAALKRHVKNVKQMKRTGAYANWAPVEWPTGAYLWDEECRLRRGIVSMW